jgi:hypothetical protein
MRGELTNGYVPKVDPIENPGGAVLEAFFKGETPDGQPLTEEEKRALAQELIKSMISEPSFLKTMRRHRNI